MEADQELRFVCKFCDKKYPCGKSLGGHLRSHVISNSGESDEKLCKNSTIELIGSSGYGLRENPKKTWRVVDSNAPLQQQQQEKVSICKQCGKGFQSLKALCGHMACHSDKERVLKDDRSWSTSQSDTEAEAPPSLPKRAASTRYKRIVIGSSLANSFSSLSEIDHEQEEVAMCLMMLSRDSGNWVGVKSVLDSSDNNSVVLETKSSSIDLRIGGNQGSNFAFNGDEARERKKLGKRKLNSGVLDPQSENSDSGYFMNGPKKVASDVSVDGLWRNCNFKGQRVDGESRLEKGLNKVKCLGTELRKPLPKEKGYIESGIASNLMKHGSRKRSVNGSYNHGLYWESCEQMLQGYSNVEVCKSAPKRSKCDSGSKKKQIGADLSCDGERELKSKKTKVHKCPICHKVYKSGQALGGHKRSHFLGGSEDRSNQSPVMKEDLSDVPDLLDLNLPAQIDDEE